MERTANQVISPMFAGRRHRPWLYDTDVPCQPILLAVGCCAPCDVLQRGSRGVREEDMHSFGLAPTVGQTDQLLVSGPQTPIHTGLIISVIITDSRVPEYIENVTWSIWANQCLFLIQP